MSGGVLPNAPLGMKFLLDYPEILPIPGVQSIAEIDELVAVLESGPLTAAEKEEIERSKQEMGNQFCRRCDYCQPCPAGINISDIMYSHTIWKRQPLEKVFTGFFGKQLEEVEECIDCGECEDRCPFDLPIREIMARNYDLYLEYEKKWKAMHS